MCFSDNLCSYTALLGLGGLHIEHQLEVQVSLLVSLDWHCVEVVLELVSEFLGLRACQLMILDLQDGCRRDEAVNASQGHGHEERSDSHQGILDTVFEDVCVLQNEL